MEYEEKLINNALVRVLKLPKYSEEEMEKASERLKKLAPYLEKVIGENIER